MARIAALEARDAPTGEVLRPVEVAALPSPTRVEGSVTGAVPESVPLLVQADAERVTTTSLVVAERFGKRHDTVLRAIRNIECSESFHLRNFAEMFYVDQAGQGAQRRQPMYQMTKDGFTFLAMGFTGREAALWKEAFIDAFNQMEQALRHKWTAPASGERIKHPADHDLMALVELTRGRLQKSVKGTAYNTVSLNTAKVLGWLRDHCQTDRRWYPFSRKAIARQVETDHTVVLRAMRRLIEWDLIEEQQGQGGLEVRLHRRRLEAEMEAARRRAFALPGPVVAATG